MMGVDQVVRLPWKNGRRDLQDRRAFFFDPELTDSLTLRVVGHSVPAVRQVSGLHPLNEEPLGDLDLEGRQIIGHLLRIQMDELFEDAKR